MQRIADALNVEQGTISKDLAGNLFQGNKLKPAKTATNPKGLRPGAESTGPVESSNVNLVANWRGH
jgi:hypothetical protein